MSKIHSTLSRGRRSLVIMQSDTMERPDNF